MNEIEWFIIGILSGIVIVELVFIFQMLFKGIVKIEIKEQIKKHINEQHSK